MLDNNRAAASATMECIEDRGDIIGLIIEAQEGLNVLEWLPRVRTY
jgi:hypothetical protein